MLHSLHLTNLYTVLTKFKKFDDQKASNVTAVQIVLVRTSISVSEPSILRISVLIEKLILAQLAVKY